MKVTKEAEALLEKTMFYVQRRKQEYITPEHLLYTLTEYKTFAESFLECGGDLFALRKNLEHYFEENLDTVEEWSSQFSAEFVTLLFEAEKKAASCEKYAIEVIHFVSSLIELQESFAVYFLLCQGIEPVQLLAIMGRIEGDETIIQKKDNEQQHCSTVLGQITTCLNEQVETQNPLIGRKIELERTMQILCRRYKNNPLHIGEPGVGKTAITYGLAKLINEGKVPDKLKDAKIYSVDLGAMLAGTKYRGDFEKRFKQLMDELLKEEKPILYIDEIHNIVGAGAVNGGSFDVSNLLKPYLVSGKIRFIGATTYEEYKKFFSKSKSLVRRFQNIDIKEPSVEEAITILHGLKKYYEEFHHVYYKKETIEQAVILSDKYINERYLPDKAIDLLDEAGAYRVMHPQSQQTQTVDKKLIEEVLSKICNVPKKTVETSDIQKLMNLEQEMETKVFGQTEAVRQLVNAVKFSKAGLNEENKPLSSLLFVGPTGVGKTESAKSLAEILGIELIRFDMSEYAEKHTVAKLIGSPAGYIGYEEGGLLTETIRKHPHCVLLLDEIEKAHGDIFNVLLQVMDYATLTDNQGNKADFRNVILIMTSNAGASNLGKAYIGFGERDRNEEVILEEVKRIFHPEFRNRLDRIIIFHSLDDKMAEKIVEKQIQLLAKKLEQKQISLQVSDTCKQYLREKGKSKEYGAREINRIINIELKPLLVDWILFERTKKEKSCYINYQNGKVVLENSHV